MLDIYFLLFYNLFRRPENGIDNAGKRVYNCIHKYI